MSYILDALTKSQAERRAEVVPTLSTPQLTAAPAKGIRIGYAGGAIGLVVGAAVLFALSARFGQNAVLYPSAQMTSSVASAASGERAPSARALHATGGAASDRPGIAGTASAQSTPTPTFSPPPSIGAVAQTGATPTSQPQVSEKVSAPLATAQAAVEQLAPATRASAAAPRNPAASNRSGGTSAAESSMHATRQRPTRVSGAASSPSRSASSKVSSSPAAEQVSLPAESDPLSPRAGTALSAETERLAKDLLAMAERPVFDSAPRPGSMPEAPDAQGAAPAAPPRDLHYEASLERNADSARNVPGGINELPADLRSSLGPLTINVHVYADVPAERLVLINMKRYREGERLPQGPRVDAITSSGALLSYQSHRFVLNAR